MPNRRSLRVAVDVGGTFTDLQIHDAASGLVNSIKTPTTPDDPSQGLLNGINEAAAKFGFAPGDVGLIMHGSTIATNAVLERKLPKGALITTAGFEDVLEIGRHIRKNVYALKAEPRALLIRRPQRYGVIERVRADGTVETPVDKSALMAIAERIRSQNVEAVAIAFLHAYRNPANEQRAADLLAEQLPNISISMSSEASPEIREYERTSTTVLNALLKPVISGYLGRLEERLQGAGIDAPIYMVQSNGGVALPDEAARMPVKLLLSGPAGGAMAMAGLARHHVIANLVGFDMGGTSSDVSVVIDGAVGETTESEIDGLPLRLPMIEIRTIGAGGGSIARVEHGALRVGPESAGAVPGPACYAKGGTMATVTDANAALGRIAPEAFMAGRMTIDVERATAAVETHIAGPLSLDRDAACAGIVEVANTHMAGAIRLSLFEKGADPAEFALAPFGGAAGLHACAIAEELDIARIVFPADASTLSARGILDADLRRDLSHSELMIAGPENAARITTIVAGLKNEAEALLARDGLAKEHWRVEFAGDLRYRGQAYEITTPWPDLDANTSVDAAAVARLIEAFHELHRIRYSHSAPDEAVELVTVRAIATGLLDHPQSGGREAPASADPPRSRSVFLDGDWREVPVYSRAAVLLQASPARPIEGPLIVEEDYTVLLVTAGWQLCRAGTSDLIAIRKEHRQ